MFQNLIDLDKNYYFKLQSTILYKQMILFIGIILFY